MHSKFTHETYSAAMTPTDMSKIIFIMLINLKLLADTIAYPDRCEYLGMVQQIYTYVRQIFVALMSIMGRATPSSRREARTPIGAGINF